MRRGADNSGGIAQKNCSWDLLGMAGTSGSYRVMLKDPIKDYIGIFSRSVQGDHGLMA